MSKAMADSPSSASSSGDADSSSGLWPVLRKILRLENARSLREQLEEAIDEHEGENGDFGRRRQWTASRRPFGGVERQMLRNLLHFSGNTDADDVAGAARRNHRSRCRDQFGRRWSPPFPNTAHFAHAGLS